MQRVAATAHTSWEEHIAHNRTTMLVQAALEHAQNTVLGSAKEHLYTLCTLACAVEHAGEEFMVDVLRQPRGGAQQEPCERVQHCG